MGYTHYWTQLRSFTADEWAAVCDDVRAILKEAQHNQGIALANGMGEGGTSPVFDARHFSFNGVGDDSHETMWINRAIPRKKEYPDHNPAWSFCKTAQKPYDTAVVAVLCYLSTVTRKDDPATGEPIIGTEAFSVTSDGDGGDLLAGLELARKAIPRKANQIDLPMEVMRSERWCAPWVQCNAKGFEIGFCVDGKGYVLKPKTGESYCFESHLALAHFLERTKQAVFRKGGATSWGGYGKIEPDIWYASGSFDDARQARIARAQSKVLAALFPADPACAQQPPAFVRPGEMPKNGGRAFCYSVADLLKLADA